MFDSKNRKMEIAVFGGGCFWCTEAVFKMLKGVRSVTPGYAGGEKESATYEKVSEGGTKHAETVEIKFDPEQIKFKDLLTVHFGSHDPTTLNRQGADVGTQYRSVIFYSNPRQKNETEEFIKELNAGSMDGTPIVTEIAPLTNFYEAENYHKDYYDRNKNQGYCQIIINPKLLKVQKNFADLLKTNKEKKYE